MRRPVQRKYAAKAAHGSHDEQGRGFPTRLHTSVQMKYVSKLTGVQRGE
jgi:hypothetical protein